MKNIFILIILLLLTWMVYGQTVLSLSELETKLIEAKNDFLIGNLDKAIAGFTMIVEQFEITKSQRPLMSQESDIFMQALNYLAQCYLASGKEHEAQYYFATLIQFQPSYELDSVLTSPKIINFYNGLRKSLIGYLSASIMPADATIYLDEQKVASGQIDKVPLMAGSHVIMIERPGHIQINKEVVVFAGKATNLGTISLTRNASVCFVTTYPYETEIILDGKTIGFTSKGAPEDLASFAKTYKLDINNFSAYFPVPIEDSLDHVIEFKKPCYQKEQIIVKYTELKDYYYESVVMKASFAQLQLESEDDAKVYLDGTFIGDLSKKNFQICAGSHKLVAKTSWGNYATDLAAKEGDAKKLTVNIKPTLLFMGIISDETVSSFSRSRVEELTTRYLTEAKDIDVLNKEKEKIITKEGDFATLDIAKKLYKALESYSSDDVKSNLELLSRNTEAHLFLFGYIQPEKTAKTVTFYLFSPMTAVPDSYVIQIDNETMWKSFFGLLTHGIPLYQYILPMLTIDAPFYDNPLVINVNKEAIGIIQEGDLITAINKKPVSVTSEIIQFLKQNKTDDIELELFSPVSNTNRTVKLKLSLSPFEIAFSNQKMLFNRQMMNLMRYLDRPNEQDKNVALFNIGLFFYKMQEWSKAFEYLNQVKILKDSRVSEQSVKYRIAQCYYELGYKKDAKKILDTIEKVNTVTIEDQLGPILSMAATSYLQLIE